MVVEANQYPISIGGIISNHEVAYSSKTTSLLIEGSIFNSKKIRQQSRILGLRTDRSARYEKGLNNSSFIHALLRLISLLRISNPDLVCKVHTTSQVKQPKLPKIILKYENIIEILGPIRDEKNDKSTQLSPIQITNYLNRLNFVFSFEEITSLVINSDTDFFELIDSKSTSRSVKTPTSFESESTTSNPDTSFSFIRSIASSTDFSENI